LTTPVPDPGPPERRGRGRNGHQQADPSWFAGPLYDDTGWHLDLSEPQDTDDRPDQVRPAGADPRPDGGRYPEPGASGDSSFRYESTYDGNGAYPPQPGYDRPASGQGQVGDRPSGRHARHARSDPDGPAAPPPRDRPGQEPYQRAWRESPGPRPGGDPYQEYGGYREPDDEAGRRGYPPPGDDSPPRQSGHGGYPQSQPYTGQLSYPEPEFRDRAGYPESRRNYPGPDAHPQPGHSEPRSFDGGPSYQDPRPYPDNPAYQDPRSHHDHPGQLDPRPHPEQPAYEDPRRDPGQLGSHPARPDPEYWSMSDPAVQPDARPDPPASNPGWDRPGEPAFMKYRDPPVYADPPGQPFTEQTMILPVMWSAQTQAADAATDDATQRAAAGSPSIVRSSGVMAIGTLASRLTGFVRTLVQVYALGLVALSTVYNNSNTLPNVVYNLALGGILTSVIVPLIVNAAKRGSDGGEAYDQRMFSLITAALLGITVVATLAAAPLVDLYKGHISGSNLHLLVIFAYFFIPQIFFYGMSSLIGAILNARGSFAAPMWTPIVNNVVVIAVLLLFMMDAGPLAGAKNPHLSGNQVLLLGVGTTLGIAAQTAALIPALRKVGFRWRPRWDFRRSEATEIGRMGGWMFCYIAATQVAFLVTTNVCNIADPQNGYSAYTYAWQLFQLPYAVVGISVITALLPRMSSHASDGRLSLVRDDFSAGVRLASVIVVPCSLILAALGPGLALVFLDHGAAAGAGGASKADYVGVVFAVFCLGLLPYMLFQLQLRVFYSLHDSKTPALIGLGTMSLNIVANVIALNVLPPHEVVAGLGVGFGLANLLGTFLAWRILSRRLHGLDGTAIRGTLVRMHAAAIPAALFAITIGLLVTDIVAGGRTGAAITIVVGGGGALLLYVMFARALRVSELTSLGRSLMARFGR
jgi:murein biosynthesis integral membrane protein MurJ